MQYNLLECGISIGMLWLHIGISLPQSIATLKKVYKHNINALL